MVAYLVATLEIKDLESFKPYIAKVPAIVEHYGGRFLVRGGELELLEGEWPFRRVTVIEFPSLEQARKWWDSSEYAEYRAIRGSAARTNAVFVQGLSA